MSIPENILSKEEFVEVIAQIQHCKDFENSVYKVFDKYMCESPSFLSCEDALIDTLNKMFNQSDDCCYGSDIEYFIYEINFGKDYTPGCLTCNDEDIDISTPEKLYDWLIRSGYKENN